MTGSRSAPPLNKDEGVLPSGVGSPEPSRRQTKWGGNGPLIYVRWAAIVTVFLYTAGYSSIGFAFLFFYALWCCLSLRPPLWQPTPVDVPLAAFGLLLMLSAVASPYRPVAVGITLMLLVSGLVYFGSFAWLLRNDPGSRTTLLRMWALGAPAAALLGLAASVVAPDHRAWIPHGVGSNGLGTTLILGSILAIGLALLPARRWERTFWLGCAIVDLLGLLGAGSRASLGGWLIGAAYLVWSKLRARPPQLLAVLVTALGVFVLAHVMAVPIGARIQTTVKDVVSDRLPLWRTTLKMIRAHPLLGTGFGTFEKAYDAVKPSGADPKPFAHNLPLNIAAETGVLGLLSALWIAAAGAREWLRAARRGPPRVDPTRPIIAALWLGLLVDQLADNTLFSISTSAALWLLLALLVLPSFERLDELSGGGVLR